MYYKLEQKEEDADHTKLFGRWGDVPPNLKEITIKEFSKSFYDIYSPLIIEFRQFVFPGELASSSCFLYIYWDNSGLIIRPIRENEEWDHSERCFKKYKAKVKYYSFASCIHEYMELNSKQATKEGRVHFGNCYHIYKCSKCGFIYEQDTSG